MFVDKFACNWAKNRVNVLAELANISQLIKFSIPMGESVASISKARLVWLITPYFASPKIPNCLLS